MTQKINPNHFTPGSQKFQPMHRPKRYVPVLFLAGVPYRVRHDYGKPSPDGFYKTATAAKDRAQRVRARWIRLYEAAKGAE